MRAPYTVVEAGPAGDAAAATATDRLVREGWYLADGFDVRPPHPRAVLRGTVSTPRDAAAALLAALDGFGLVVRAAAEPEVVDRLVDDLRRLGPVEHGPATPHAEPGPALHAEGRAILGLLAEGSSLGEAAHLLGLSRRTADRRLADARRALGVARTTEAIARAARLGWLRDGPG